MKTYLDKQTHKWVSYKPTYYWSGLLDINNNKIFVGDTFKVLNAAGHNKPIILECTDDIANNGNVYYNNKQLKYLLI